ncbi:MAG: hypothetical protein M3Q22_04115 [Actinomycetota bacterium]|nr:hypothetical protein [Actinomycetota bacterium]
MDAVDAEPPHELLRFLPSQPAPIGPHGRPEPWQVKWTAAEFGEWLQARQRWRETHTQLLPGLFARNRFALHRLADELDRQVVADELAAPTAGPEWASGGRPPAGTWRGRLAASAVPLLRDGLT